jgi:hypothetical protein
MLSGYGQQQQPFVAVSASWYALGMTEEYPKRRKWFQFRLRTLLIIVLVLSLPLSWLAVRMQKARQQREAMDLLESKGCFMLYPFGWWVDGISVPDGVLGANSRVTDADLRHLQALSDVEAINLNNTGITDDGLRHLGSLTQLRSLSLESTAITDNGLTHLSDLKNLEYLYLDRTSITDAGVKHLMRLPNLRVLGAYNQVTPAGYAKLKEAMPNCLIE